MTKATSLFKRTTTAAEETRVPVLVEAATLAETNPEALCRLANRTGTSLTVRFSAVVAWEHELSKHSREVDLTTGVRVYFSNGDSVYLELLSFSSVAEAFREFYGTSFARDFLCDPAGAKFYVRASAILGWSDIDGGWFYLAGSHNLHCRYEIQEQISPAPRPKTWWAIQAGPTDSTEEYLATHGLTVVKTVQ